MSSSRMAGIVRRAQKIRGNMTPDPTWQNVGTYRGVPVYREKVPNLYLAPMLGADGEALMVTDKSTGIPLRTRMKEVQHTEDPWIFRDFQLVDLGNGIVKKNFHFKGEDRPVEASLADQQALEIAELREAVDALIQQAAAASVRADNAESKLTAHEGETVAPAKPKKGPRKQPAKRTAKQEQTAS